MTTALGERIERLDDQTALRALAAVVDKQGGVLGTQAAAVAESRVREALAQPEMAEFAGVTTAANEGDVARAALAFLVEDASLAPDVERALTIAPAGDERLEPVIMAVGTLVLFVLRSEVELRKDPERGWSFHFHHRPIKDSLLGTIFAKLVAAAGGTD